MNEPSKPPIKIGLWNALYAIALVGSSLAGAGWHVGRSLLQDELTQYKQAESWKVPEAIQKIKKLSSELTEKLEKINDYDTLKEYKRLTEQKLKAKELEVEELKTNYETQIQKLEIELSEQQAKRIEAETKLQDMQGEVIYISEGEAKPVGHKSIKVGISSIPILQGWASVKSGEFNNSTMEVGESFQKDVNGKTYIITLVKITQKKCGFSFDILQKRKSNN